MSGDALVHVATEAMYLVLLLSAPPLVAVLVVGVGASLLAGALRVEEPTVTTVPKIAAALVALAVAAPWIGGELVRFTDAMLAALPSLGKH